MRTTRSPIIVISVALLLVGCAASTVKEIKSNPAKATKVNIAENYQRVYKNVLDRMRECMGEGTVGAYAQLHIRHSLFNDLGEANISVVMSNLGVQNHYLHIDFRRMGANDQMLLEGYAFFSTWTPALDNVVVWATDPDAPCQPITPETDARLPY